MSTEKVIVDAATDIAPVVSFLLSKDAKWLRGTNVEADGGMKSHIIAEQHGI